MSLAASSPPARVAAVASDLASLLARFAFRRSFSDESHGGGKHSNARLLLYLLQMGRYFADFAAQPELQVCVALQMMICRAPEPACLLCRPCLYLLQLAYTPAESAICWDEIGQPRCWAGRTSWHEADCDPDLCWVQGHHASLKQLLVWPPEAPAASSSSPRNKAPRTAFQLALSLLLTSPGEWSAALRSVLLNVLRGSADALGGNSQQEPEAGSAQSAAEPEGTSSGATPANLVAAFSQLDEAARLQQLGPMLKLAALVNRLQSLKGSGASWHETLRVRCGNHASTVPEWVWQRLVLKMQLTCGAALSSGFGLECWGQHCMQASTCCGRGSKLCLSCAKLAGEGL